MRVVNKFGMPDLIFKFLSNDMYDFVPNPTSVSGTGLLKPPREKLLTDRHNSEIEVDAGSRIWSLFGQGVHAVLEHGNLSDKQEERMTIKFNGFTVSGKFDLIIDNQLNDFKTLFSYTLTHNTREKEWTEQLSIYRWLYFKKHGKELNSSGKIIAIIKDWKKKYLGVTENYPSGPVVEIVLPLMSFDETEKFVAGKIDVLKQLAEVPDDELPVCSDEDTWMGNKCEDYCLAYNFCNCRRQKPPRKKKSKKIQEETQ
jgi:hypothetical protein